MNRPRQLFLSINLDAQDPNFFEAGGHLFPDSGSNFGAPEELGAREAIELRFIVSNEFLFGGRSHGYNGVGARRYDLGSDFSAGEDQAQKMDTALARHRSRHLCGGKSSRGNFANDGPDNVWKFLFHNFFAWVEIPFPFQT